MSDLFKNSEANGKTWAETTKDLSFDQLRTFYAVALGSLQVTSTPENFANACRIALGYAKPVPSEAK